MTELVEIPHAGLSIPRIGLGTFQTPPDETERLVAAALEVGYRHVDTAALYQNESGVGRAIRNSSVPRGEIFLTTKVPRTEASATDAPRAARTSLRELGLDYVDLLLLHWPNNDVPPEETFEALLPLLDDGSVRALGFSNGPAALVRRAMAVAPLANIQVEYHPYLSQQKLRDLVAEAGLSLTAYSPFAQGRVFDDPLLKKVGAKYGKNGGQVALRWILDQPRTVVIPKTANLDRLAGNLEVFDFALDDDDRQAVDALSAARERIFDPPWRMDWDER